MKTHELKLDIKYFNDVESGKKNFEIRKNDRDFKVGDILELKAYENGMYRHTIQREVRGKGFEDWTRASSAEQADTIKAKVTWVLDIFENSFESGCKMAETVPGTGDDLVELSIDIRIVLREYFGLVDLPDGYVILGIEVVK
ncbi:DUF3850 domain-containing protein [Lactococcus lactis]|uniref:DUF3850 domain-containing protein n=1 Tax=Lactococcus lactis TaxID=1358 RepID=UPI0024A80AA5|nr:DUF3850 domain-containing protein [Lactococcus lactis]